MPHAADFSIKRRHFLAAGGLAAASFTLPGAAAAFALPGLGAQGLPLVASPPPGQLFGLARSLRDEHDYRPEVKGQVPKDLRGVLYRNGPGLFDRGGLRKRCLIDGDGMVQMFRFDGDGAVFFRNRFVRTAKFVEEEAADRFLYATFTTQAPGGLLSNFLARSISNQAGVTVVARGGRLYAFDETTEPYELDPATLDTVGLSHLGAPVGTAVYAAHSKIDPATGEWIHFGLDYAQHVTLHVTIFDRSGRLAQHRTLKLPRYVYLHDFFATERYLVFNLHASEIAVVPFLAGIRSFAGSFRWRPEIGNLILVMDRYGDAEALQLEAPPCWMWHSLNAFERDGEIVADFVGYDAPDHFIGPDARFFAIMEGRPGKAQNPGKLRRYVIDLRSKRLREEILSHENHEYPIINPGLACHQHRYGYFATARPDDLYLTGIARIDTDGGAIGAFRFDDGQYCGEAVFAPV